MHHYPGLMPRNPRVEPGAAGRGAVSTERETMDTVELDWLETFLAVVDQGGFTAASEHIHRSQSRVSAHIAGLERALGVQLIDRHRRPAALTDAGVVLSRHARAVL